jgi:hypothetical protein
MECTGPAKGAADFFSGDGLADVVHNNQSRMGGIAQTEQSLTESRHGAGVVFILIVSRVERVQDDHLGGGSLGGGEEVIQSLECA